MAGGLLFFWELCGTLAPMTIIGSRKISYAISGTLVVLSFLSLAVWGLKPGIDFTGGSLLEVAFESERPENEKISTALLKAGIDHVVVQPTGEKGVIMRFKPVDEKSHQDAIGALKKLGALEERRFDSIGPTIGQELRRNSIWAIAIVLIMIVIYIAWAFRSTQTVGSRHISSWKYGITAIIALIHDVAIPTGVFAVLGHFYGVEVDTLFVTALLTILGFSVHDTIVVFDRIRENLKRLPNKNFEEVVEQSVRDTVTRSINTSLTVLIVIIALFVWGGVTTQFFSLAILIGVFFGVYSSIFVASALLVTWHRFSLRRTYLR